MIPYDEVLMKFSIETVSRMTGIAAASLRNWEKRYGFPLPTRTEGGHRYYCTRDIDFLKRASVWIEEGYNLPQIGDLYKKEKSARCELVASQPEEVSQKTTPQVQQIFDDVAFRVELIYQALLNYEVHNIQQHYCILNAKLSPGQLFDRVFETILRRIRTEWPQGRITIAQEHFISSFLQIKLASFLAIEFPATHQRPIFAASLSEEKSEIGLMLLSAHLKFRGYPVFYFGLDLPFTDLKTICREVKPAVVALPYMSLDYLRRDLPLFAELEIPVVVGGLALCESPQLSIIKDQAPRNVHFCDKKVGSEAAQFVELICQAKS